VLSTPNRVVVLLEPGHSVLAADVAQLLQEGPGDVELGHGVEGFEPPGAADPVQPLEPVVLAVEHARADEASDKVRRAQLRQQG
jgi:hypothetical protein